MRLSLHPAISVTGLSSTVRCMAGGYVVHWSDPLPFHPAAWGSDPAAFNALVFVSALSKTADCFEISRLLDVHVQLKRAASTFSILKVDFLVHEKYYKINK